MSDATRQTVSVVNSFLLFATLGMLGFIGHVSWQNSLKLEALSAGQITRSEFESKVGQLRADYDGVKQQLADLALEVSKLRRVP